MYCKKCGAYNSGNSLRCKNCGDYLVNQYNNTENIEEERKQDKINSNNDKHSNNKDNKPSKNNNKHNSRNKKEKVKYKKVKSRKKDSIFNKNKDKDKSKKNNAKKNNYQEKEVIVKTSLFSEFMIFFLSLLVIALIAICSFLGLYILKDKVVMMPDVIGLNINDAKNILDENGISYSIQEKSTSDDNVDKVLEQDPNSGKYIFKNKTVKITVGSNLNNKTHTDTNTNDTTSTNNNEIILDNYVGLNLDDAINKLDNLHLKYEIRKTDEKGDINTVIKQSPSANSKINEDTTIILYISSSNTDTTSSTDGNNLEKNNLNN